ncbi:hypothetical protein Tco_1300371 [Tanacetum coccineum]
MEDPRESFNELMDTPLDFLAFVMNRLKVDTLTPELLAGPTFELMKGSSCHQYPNDLQKPLPLIPNFQGRHVIPFDYFINNDLAYLSGGVSSRTYTTSVTKTKAVDYRHIKWIEDLVPNTMWSQVPHLDWITVRRDDDKLYTFKEGNFNRLRIQDIEDMLLFLVQGKLKNLTVEERLAFNTALDDRLKGIQMKYLPQTIWRQSDRDKAGAMIQAIDKQLKTRRIMRSLEKFVDKMDSMHSTLSMYYDYDAHVKGELLVMMKNSQSVNLLIFISNTLIELFNDFGFDCDGIPERPTMYLNLWSYKVVRYSHGPSDAMYNPPQPLKLEKEVEELSFRGFRKELWFRGGSSCEWRCRVRHNQEFDMGNNDEQPNDEAASKVDWFKKSEQPTTPDPDWNKRQHVNFRNPPQT